MKNTQYHDRVQVRLVSRQLQSETQEELRPLFGPFGRCCRPLKGMVPNPCCDHREGRSRESCDDYVIATLAETARAGERSPRRLRSVPIMRTLRGFAAFARNDMPAKISR